MIAVACGGPRPAPAPQRVVIGGQIDAGAAPAPDAAAAYDPSGCAPQPGITAAACAAEGDGCQVGPPPYCSGVRLPDDEMERLRHGPCECVCPAEIMKCAEVP